MSAQTAVERRFNDRELAVRTQLEVWEGHNRRLGDLLFHLSDEQLARQISPSRPTGLYILGHLTALSDGLLPSLGLGEMQFPHLVNAFMKEPEFADDVPPPATEIRHAWAEAVSTLNDKLTRLSTEEWFARHAAASDEEFDDELNRRKINVLIDGTRHVSHHLGELTLLKSKGGN